MHLHREHGAARRISVGPDRKEAEKRAAEVNAQLSKGKRRKAAQGGYVGGWLPYGYRRGKRRAVVVEEEAGDYIEVTFEKKAGYFRETENDHVMEKVDEEGNLLGFSIIGVSLLKKNALEVALS